jgi:hypothetical protein
MPYNCVQAKKIIRLHYINVNIIYYCCFDVGGVIAGVLQGMDVYDIIRTYYIHNVSRGKQ